MYKNQFFNATNTNNHKTIQTFNKYYKRNMFMLYILNNINSNIYALCKFKRIKQLTREC